MAACREYNRTTGLSLDRQALKFETSLRVKGSRPKSMATRRSTDAAVYYVCVSVSVCVCVCVRVWERENE